MGGISGSTRRSTPYLGDELAMMVPDSETVPPDRALAPHEPGVEVVGAGTAHANGWYSRRENSEGPPPTYSRYNTSEQWAELTKGRQWYWKDDAIDGGWSICWDKWGWRLCCEKGLKFSYRQPEVPNYYYLANCNDGPLPPAEGWEDYPHLIGDKPAPTLRVVS